MSNEPFNDKDLSIKIEKIVNDKLRPFQHNLNQLNNNINNIKNQ
jgi:hypothetical protein